MLATTITIVNKLPRKYAKTNRDEWYKFRLYNIPYKIKENTGFSGTTLIKDQSWTILLPFDDKYVTPRSWFKRDNHTGIYTLNQGDYIFLNNLTDEVTSDNLQTLRQENLQEVCEVRSIFEVAPHSGITYRFEIGGV